MINIFSNTLGAEEVSAVQRVMKSRWLGRGKECAEFEKELGAYWHTNNILLFNSCTSAIYAAIRALGIKAGDEVIISTINFVACLSAVLESGATPVFADVEKDTLNISPSEISRLRTDKTQAILMMHYAGNPADMDAILQAAWPIPVIEDCACAVASIYKGQACGTIGAAGCWSFDAMKILVTGDGGALRINDTYFEKVKSIRYLGMNEGSSTGMDKASNGESRWWEYSLVLPSGRFIGNDITSAMGREQLKKLPSFIQRRKEIWSIYQCDLAYTGDITLPPEPIAGCESSYYSFWIFTSMRDQLAVYLKDHGIYTTFRYYPLHYVTKAETILLNAEEASDTCLNLPLHQNLSDYEVSFICQKIKDFYIERQYNI